MLLNEPYYVLRTPRLSIDNFLRKSRQLSINDLPAFIKEMYVAPEMEETLYLASPELYHQYQKWLQGKLKDKKEEKLLLSLYKYLLRICSRCTPFGLFAGCSIGEIGQHSAFTAETYLNSKKHSRLDMNYVAELADVLLKNDEIRSQLKFYPNNSIYRVHDKYRYVGATLKNRQRAYHVYAVDHSLYLERLFEKARKGAFLRDLAETIVDDEISFEEASAFINELAESRLLISELEATVTGEEFFEVLKKTISGITNAAALLEKLVAIDEILKTGSHSLSNFTRVNQLIQDAGVITDSKDLIQTDLFFSHPQNRLAQKVADRLAKNIETLYRMFAYSPLIDLEQFKTDFYNRYEEKEVPLSQALDAESGIGYGRFKSGGDADHTPLLDALTWNAAPDKSSLLTEFSVLRLRKYTDALANQLMEIEITEEEIEALGNTNYQDYIPPGICLIGDLLASSVEQLDNGTFNFLIKGCAGPSAGSLLARFCHGDKKLAGLVRQTMDKEQQTEPDRIMAEIVHLPHSRVGNILMRPVLHKYEIPYLCKSAVEEDYQIPIEDLMVSVRNNRIVLRSKKLNKEILPRLTSAFSYKTTNLMTFKFLCDLQSQQINISAFWTWGQLSTQDFLPRVKVNHAILSRATWNLHSKRYPELEDKKIDQVAFIKALQQKVKLPDLVVLIEGDNELLIDLTHETGIRLLLEQWRKKTSITVAEFLCTPENCFISDRNGNKYANEFIIPLHRPVIKNNQPAAINIWPATIQRQFMPGSQWLYIKLYTGTTTGDRILADLIKPLTDSLLEQGIIKQWFYIRYFDPAPHLRLRFYNDERPDFTHKIMQQLHETCKELLENDVISSLQIDTYNREVERYMPATMEASEQIFFHDSSLIVHFIHLLGGDNSETYRWLFAIRNIDQLLSDFNYPLEGKHAVTKNLRDAFFKEFMGDTELHISLNDKYRLHSKTIREILDYEPCEYDLSEMTPWLHERSEKLAPVVAFIKEQQPFYVTDLVCSYIHMSLNRLFISSHRKHELVIYHMMSRFYESKIAILKKQNQNN